MKSKERLRVPVRLQHSARKFYLQERAGIYYVRFDVPEWIRKIDPTLPRTVFQSLDTNILPAAKVKAREKIEAVFEKRFEDYERTRKQAPSYAPLCAVLALYQPDPRVVQPGIAVKNRSTLALLCREAIGQNDVDELPTDRVLSKDVWERWRDQRIAQSANKNYLDQESSARTINAMLAQARSVFSPKVMHLYSSLRLPDLSGVRSVRRLKTNKAAMRFKPIPPETLRAMQVDSMRLKIDEPEVYKVYLLMLGLGMRNSEVQFARWSWIERRGDGAVMSVAHRADFEPKNGVEREIGIPASLLRELDTWRALPDAWIIALPTPTERYWASHRGINKWVRPFLPGRKKGAYNLRKQAGSEVLTRSGSMAAAAEFLGDSVATTEAHYGRYLREVQGVNPAEISRLPAVA